MPQRMKNDKKVHFTLCMRFESSVKRKVSKSVAAYSSFQLNALFKARNLQQEVIFELMGANTALTYNTAMLL